MRLVARSHIIAPCDKNKTDARRREHILETTQQTAKVGFSIYALSTCCLAQLIELIEHEDDLDTCSLALAMGQECSKPTRGDSTIPQTRGRRLGLT